jgi:DNA-directed RNA polymerase subunit RPC12/RpoP
MSEYDCTDCGQPARIFLPEGRYLCRSCWRELRELRSYVVKGVRMSEWQHKTPQRDLGHAVKPHASDKTCQMCGQPIKKVPDNDGPERLKALFPMGGR